MSEKSRWAAQSVGLEPDEILLVESLETLKVVADPLRLQVLALLRDEPRTVKQLAAALHTPLKGLYYHVNLLEEHGLVRVAETRVVSGIIEKRYRVTAYRISVEKDLLTPHAPAPGALDAYLSLVLDHVRAEIRRSVRAGLIDMARFPDEKGGLVLGRYWMRMTRQQAEEYMRRLKQVDEEFLENLPPPGDGPEERYEVLLGLYPVLPPEGDAGGPGADGTGGAAQAGGRG